MRWTRPLKDEGEREYLEQLTSVGGCCFLLLVSFIGICLVVFLPENTQRFPLFDRFFALFGALIGVIFGIARVRLLNEGKAFRFWLANEVVISAIASVALFLIATQWFEPKVIAQNSSRYFSNVTLFASGIASALTMLLVGLYTRHKSN